MTKSNHTELRMKQRGITDRMIQNCIKNGKKEKGNGCVVYLNRFIVVKVSYDDNIITVQHSKTSQEGIKVYKKRYGVSWSKAIDYYFTVRGCYSVS